MKKNVVLVILTLFQCTHSYSQESTPVPKHVTENTRYLVGKWTADVESTFEGKGSGIYLGKPMKEKISVERKGRDEFIWKASSIQVGGEAMPDEVYRFQRDADEIESWLKYFVGQWSRETKVWTEADGWKTTSETWECEHTAGGNATVSRGRTSEGVEWTGMEARFGSAATIEQGAASDGASWKVLWNEFDAHRVSGSLAGYVPSGLKGEGNISIDRKEKAYVAKWEIKLTDGSIMKGIETNTRK